MKRTWMLGAAVLAGALSLGTTQAKAAEFGVYVGGPVAYAPPCPGPGYEWVAGYRTGGDWVPGRWNFVGVRGHYDRDAYFDRGRRDDRRDDRDRDRHFDRDDNHRR